MSNLMPSDITDAVANVLHHASRGDGDRPNFLTAYQILDRLPPDIRDRLIEERTLGGQGAGVSYSAASIVSDAAGMLPSIVVEYIDTRGMEMQVAGQGITTGFPVSAIYRL